MPPLFFAEGEEGTVNGHVGDEGDVWGGLPLVKEET